jgi:hypothetical protein
MSTQYAVYPPLGCARVGDSTRSDGWFIGPEIPGRAAVPADGQYKDSKGRIKRQGARFRVYELDGQGAIVREVTEGNGVSIEWTVHVANKKASWYDFNNALDLAVVSPRFEDQPLAVPLTAERRNSNVVGSWRRGLNIDPGPVKVCGRSQGPIPLRGTFRDTPVQLGDLRTDEFGRLIFLGGFGKSDSPSPANPIQNYSNNAGWYDDMSDGWVKAEVILADTTRVAAKPGWVFVGPPDYAPDLNPLITLYDLMRAVAAKEGKLTPPEEPSFTNDIFPLLSRLSQMQWVSQAANLRYGWRTAFDFFHGDLVKDLADPSEEHKDLRQKIFQALRSPAYDTRDDPIVPFQSADSSQLGGPELIERVLFKDGRIPFLLGDGINFPGNPMQWFAIPEFFYEMMRKWADGKFVADWNKLPPKPIPEKFEDIPLDDQPVALTRAALEPVFGGAFHPGVELTWPMRHWRMYSELFRIKMSEGEDPDRDYGPVLTAEIAMADGGPLDSNYPGSLTRWMGLPWQCDAASCQNVYLPQDFPIPVWWPANLPVDVLPTAYYEHSLDTTLPEEQRRRFFSSRVPWTRGVGAVGYHAQGGYMQAITHIVNDWAYLGFVVRKPGPERVEVDPPGLEPLPSIMYVETERGQLQT